MPRGKLSKDEIKYLILTQKHRVYQDSASYEQKAFANHHLNELLNKLEEFRF